MISSVVNAPRRGGGEQLRPTPPGRRGSDVPCPSGGAVSSKTQSCVIAAMIASTSLASNAALNRSTAARRVHGCRPNRARSSCCGPASAGTVAPRADQARMPVGVLGAREPGPHRDDRLRVEVRVGAERAAEVPGVHEVVGGELHRVLAARMVAEGQVHGAFQRPGSATAAAASAAAAARRTRPRGRRRAGRRR